MLSIRTTILLGACACLALTIGLALGEGPGGVSAPAADDARGAMTGLAPAPIGPADPTATLEVGLALRGQDPRGLQAALAARLDPSSPEYQRTLSPEAFGDRYGLARVDEDQLVATLQAAGLTVIGRVPQRTSVRVAGTVADLERVLGLTLQRYREPRTGSEHLAAGSAPTVPPALANAVSGILGVDPRLPVSALVQAPAPPMPGRGLGPRDLALAYGYDTLWDDGITGQGKAVAILQYGLDSDADLAVYDAAFGIQGPVPERIAVGDGLRDAPVAFALEAALDTQVVRATAPGASILVFGFENRMSIARAVDEIVKDGRAKVISLSYGKCFVPGEYIHPEEVGLGHQSFAAAALAGVTMYAASGDWGAYTCHVFDPADHQESTFWPSCTDNVVGVGGTFLETRADGSYLRETGWQDYLTTDGAGGGISPVDPMPAWQAGAGVQNGRSTGNRQCPDVAAVSDPDSGYLIYLTDPASGTAGWRMVGGTSAAAPLWAGIQALMQQAAAQQGIDQLGFLLPRLYQLAASDPDAFHDVRRGGNLVAESGPGWDYATGLGSPDVAALTAALIRSIGAGS